MQVGMRVGIVQVCSTDDLSANLARAEAGVREAAARGATLVALPENFAFMRRLWHLQIFSHAHGFIV